MIGLVLLETDRVLLVDMVRAMDRDLVIGQISDLI